MFSNFQSSQSVLLTSPWHQEAKIEMKYIYIYIYIDSLTVYHLADYMVYVLSKYHTNLYMLLLKCKINLLKSLNY